MKPECHFGDLYSCPVCAKVLCVTNMEVIIQWKMEKDQQQYKQLLLNYRWPNFSCLLRTRLVMCLHNSLQAQIREAKFNTT